MTHARRLSNQHDGTSYLEQLRAIVAFTGQTVKEVEAQAENLSFTELLCHHAKTKAQQAQMPRLTETPMVYPQQEWQSGMSLV